MKKLIIAICLLLVTAALLGTSTFAWFSMNDKVNVTGMAVRTKVDSNLYIASSSAGTEKADDADFKSGLDSTVTGTLQPVSTTDAISFYYTYDSSADGKSLPDKEYTELTSNKITVGGVDYKGYVDQVFELKAVNAGATAKDITLSKVNLLYQGANTTSTAFRIAVFVQDEADSGYVSRSSTSADTILATGTDAADVYFNGLGVANTADDATTADDDERYGEIANFAEGISLEVAAGETAYYKITVRLWIEGEDPTCITDNYVDLSGNWTLDLSFSFNGNSAVTTYSSTANATATTANGAVLNNSETAVSYAWMKVGANGSDTAYTGTGSTAKAWPNPAASTNDEYYYCEITTASGTVYRTNAIKVAKKAAS